MTIEVVDADGTVIEFPDGTPQATITSVMRQRDQERAARASGVDTGGRTLPPPRQAPPQPNRQQREQVALAQLQRNQMRGTSPFGSIIEPLTTMVTDPARRAEFGRSMQGLWRDIQQIPSLDAGRLVRDTTASAQRGLENLPATIGAAIVHLPQIARAATYGPFEDAENAQRRIDLARATGDAAGVQQGARDANTATGGALTNTAAGLLGPAVRTPLQAAGLGVALDAPHALSRNSDQPLQERLPGALTEMGGVAATGAGLQAGFNALARGATTPPPRNSMTERVNTFNRAGVRPTLSAVTAPEPPVNVPVSPDAGRVAAAARAISENPIVGFMPGGHMRRSLGDTAAAAERLARRYGPRTGPESAGRSLQEGMRRWAFGEGASRPPPHADVRNWSFDQRAGQLYDEVFGEIGQAERQWAQRGQRPPITADATRQTLEDILGRNTADVAELINDPQLYRFRNILVNDARDAAAGGGRSFQDLRDLRTYVRNLQRRDPSMRPNMPDAALERLESALTQDINASARFIAGERIAQRLQTVDRYYRMGSERIRTALRPFMREGESAAQAYRRAVALASEGGRQNTQALIAARRSVQPYEWRQVQATAIDEMGRAARGHPYAAEGAFSAEQFATRYNAMSPEGRRAFFGDLGEGGPGELAAALDDLARVAGMQKAVERAANHSNTAVVAQTGSTIGGLITAPQVTIPILFGMAAIGEALTNPAFVRWITSAAKSGAGVGGIRRQLAALAKIARADPAVAVYAAELEARLADERSQRGASPARGPVRTPPQREPAFQ